MPDKRDIRFFPLFIGATVGVLLEEIGILVDEIVIGNISTDEAFASVNLIEPYMYFEVFIGYLISVAAAAFVVRAHGAGDHKKMGDLFSQTLIVCGICGVILTSIYTLFTPDLVRLVADDPAVYDGALDYFNAMRFDPLVVLFDTFLLTYVLYRGGYVQYYVAGVSRVGINALLSWQLGLQMGLFGVGLASVISNMVELLIVCTFLFTKKHGIRFRWHLNFREVLEIARVGFPESALAIFMILFEMLVNTNTLENYGASGVAAVAIVINVFEIVFYLSEGISEYEIVAMNDSIGKNSSERMDYSIKITKRAAMIEGIVLTAIILCMSFIMPAAFDIDDAETAGRATIMLIILAPATIFICFSRIAGVFYQYTRRVLRAIVMIGMAIAVLPILFSMLFGQIALEGIAAGIASGPVVAIGLMYGYVRFIKKEKLFSYGMCKVQEV